MFGLRGRATAALVAYLLAPVGIDGQTQADALHRPFDEILDLNVRDGFVYYAALRQTRGELDRYVASLDVPPDVLERWSRDERLAFWLNAYNAFVLQTVIDRYPIRGRATEYPPNSIRQIHGAFDKRTFRAGRRALTLDDVEKKILPEFKEPRAYFAVSAGAVGSGRLRSEAYRGGNLESQLVAATKEFFTTLEHVELDRGLGELRISAIIGWHEQEFSTAYATGDTRFSGRSPIERAAIGLLSPYVYPSERQFLERNEFRVRYKEFDWTLNDLTGGRK
jgi:hypothetical protein